MLPSLPPELLDLILSYAIPPPSRSSGPIRTRLLLSLSLVSRDWRAFAQARLIRDITLSTEKQALKLNKLFDRGVLNPLDVQTLVLNAPPLDINRPEERQTLKQGMKDRWRKLKGRKSEREVVLGVAKRLEKVRIVWCEAPSYDRAQGTREEDLLEVVMRYKEKLGWGFISLDGLPCSSSITSLSFSRMSSSIDWSTTASLDFPNVVHLSLGDFVSGTAPYVYDPSGTFITNHWVVEPLAEQLTSLMLSLETGFNALVHLSECEKLETLFYDVKIEQTSFATLLEVLPPTIITLHLVGLRPEVDGFRGWSWEHYMKDWTATKWGGRLRKLVLWPRLGQEMDEEEVASLRDVCGAHEVELVVVSGGRKELVTEDRDPNEF